MPAKKLPWTTIAPLLRDHWEGSRAAAAVFRDRGVWAYVESACRRVAHGWGEDERSVTVDDLLSGTLVAVVDKAEARGGLPVSADRIEDDAGPWLRLVLLNAARDTARRLVRPSGVATQNRSRLRRDLAVARDAASRRLGRPPTHREVADEAGLTLDRYWQIHADLGVQVQSLDARDDAPVDLPAPTDALAAALDHRDVTRLLAGALAQGVRPCHLLAALFVLGPELITLDAVERAAEDRQSGIARPAPETLDLVPPWSTFLGTEHDQRAERLVLAWVLLCAHPLVATLLGSARSWQAASPADADRARDLVRKWTDRGREKLFAMGVR